MVKSDSFILQNYSSLFQHEKLLSWHWSVKSDQLRLSPSLAQFLGVEEHQVYSWAQLLSWCPLNSQLALQNCKAKMLDAEGGFSLEFNIHDRGGKTHKLMMRLFIRHGLVSGDREITAIGWSDDQTNPNVLTKYDFSLLLGQDLEEPIPNIRKLAVVLQKSSENTGNLIDFLDINRLAELANYSQSLISSLIHVFQEETQQRREQYTAFSYLNSVKQQYAVDPAVEIVVQGALSSAVTFSPSLMEIIFHNLVHNGIRHNNKQLKKIELGFIDVNGTGYFYVKDNGPGLTGAMLEKIAAKTHSLPAQTVDPEGAGLGLYLVKRLLERYHGELRCETELGVGTTMFFPVL